MTTWSEADICQRARGLQVELWRRRVELGLKVEDALDLLPISPRLFAEHLLKLRFEEPQEIPSFLGWSSTGGLETAVAGYLDRQQRTIVVAQCFKPEWRRYTAAHEVGHYCLHQELIQHRDRPLTGGERANRKRPQNEQQADLFAAELVMPTKLLTRSFSQRFGKQIDGREPDDTLAHWLSAGNNERIGGLELASRGPMFRALLAAQSNLFEGRSFVPLADFFGVSRTAMAIQLKDLQLVL